MSPKSTFLQNFTGQNLEPASGGLAESIQNHLSLLLNARQGMTTHLTNYGLPDIHYIYYSLPRSLESLADDIKATIVQYEPRIKNVEVRLLDSSAETFRATYQIAAEIIEGSEVSRIKFKTEVQRDGLTETSRVK